MTGQFIGAGIVWKVAWQTAAGQREALAIALSNCGPISWYISAFQSFTFSLLCSHALYENHC